MSTVFIVVKHRPSPTNEWHYPDDGKGWGEFYKVFGSRQKAKAWLFNNRLVSDEDRKYFQILERNVTLE